MEVTVNVNHIKPAAVSGSTYQRSEENTSSSKLNNCLGVALHEPQKNLAVGDQQTNTDGVAKDFQQNDTSLHSRSSIRATAKAFINTLAQEGSKMINDLLGHGDYLHGAYHYTDADVPYESYRKSNQEIAEFIKNVGGDIKKYSTESNDTFNGKESDLSSTVNYIDVFMTIKLDSILQNEKALKELPNQSQIKNPEASRNNFMQFIKQDNVYNFIEKYCPDSCKEIAKEIRATDLSDIEQIYNISLLIKEANKLQVN